MLNKIIATDHHGASSGAINAARALSLKVGGHTYRSDDSSEPNLKYITDKKIKIVDGTEDNRRSAIMMNIKNADATVRIASDFSIEPDILTMMTRRVHPYYDFHPAANGEFYEVVERGNINQLADTIMNNGIKNLHVTGNREYQSFGIAFWTANFLARVFRLVAARS